VITGRKYIHVHVSALLYYYSEMKGKLLNYLRETDSSSARSRYCYHGNDILKGLPVHNKTFLSYDCHQNDGLLKQKIFLTIHRGIMMSDTIYNYVILTKCIDVINEP